MEPTMVTTIPRIIETQDAQKFQSFIVGFFKISQMRGGNL